ncbi:MAG: DUF4262 domain-containing protein [Herpetosiphon sp.]|nr:DUF4262 domain-containing protein [Herpetosiphon sp.]
MIDDLDITDEEKQYFKHLLATDPQANLEQRYAFFQDYNPDYAQNRFGFLPQLIERDWMVIAFNDQDFSYTAGLYYRYNQPEIMLASSQRDMLERMHILNTIGTFVRDGTVLEEGKNYAAVMFDDSLFQISTLTFRRYTQADFEVMPCGLLFSFYQFFKDELFEDGNDIPMLIAEIDEPAKLPSVEKRLDSMIKGWFKGRK